MAKAPVNFNTLLQQVNAVRFATHRQPIAAMPKGTPRDYYTCPIARALSNGWEARVVVEEVELYRDSLLREEAKPIIDALRVAGFRGVVVMENFRGQVKGIRFFCTATMMNFIERFDEREFVHLIEGGSNGQG